MGQINRFPEGFLDTLGAKTDGRTPRQSSEALAPVIEIGDLYRAQLISGEPSTLLSDTSVNATLSITVPDGETWLLFSGSVFIQAIALATIKLDFVLAGLPDLGVNFFAPLHTTGLLSNTVAVEAITDTFVLPQRIAAPSGSSIRATVRHASLANMDWQITVGFIRLQ